MSIRQGVSQDYERKVAGLLGQPVYGYLCGQKAEEGKWGWRRKLTIRAHTSLQEHYTQNEIEKLRKELSENLDGLVWCF